MNRRIVLSLLSILAAMPAVPAAPKGVMPAATFRTGQHTHALVPFFARGVGAEAIGALADEEDPVRGAYLDSAELGRYLAGLAERAEQTAPTP
jgi:hypothetical protein